MLCFGLGSANRTSYVRGHSGVIGPEQSETVLPE